MKIAPIIHAFNASKTRGGLIHYRLIHTGQHYDPLMSDEFFRQLKIPVPDINFQVGSGTQAEQTAAIMMNYERILLDAPSDLCLVVGDVTSTMACAITAQKLRIPVAHVEAGIRSGDWSMPEEINRILTDAITNWFFTTSEIANTNLRKNGVTDDKIFFVGNTMVDTLLANMSLLQEPLFWNSLGLKNSQYFVVTLHRPINVDRSENFACLLRAIAQSTRGLPVIFPVHPRTAKTLRNLNTLPESIYLVEPQPYLEFNYLVKHALAVITDSGGISEETTVMRVPCLTLRDSTERPETVSIGTNELIGADPMALRASLDKVFKGQWKTGSTPEKWDGCAGERIVQVLEILMAQSSTSLCKH